MSASPATLPDIDGLSDSPESPNGRRYSPADKEAAYQLWRQTAGRSLTQTAGILGISPDTLWRWHAQENWKQRATDEDTSAGKSTADIARAMVAPQFVKAIIAIDRILSDPNVLARNPNAVVKAAELAAGWNGLVVPKAPAITLTKNLGDGSTISVKASDLGTLSPAELAHYARTGELPASATPDPDEG